MFTSLALDQVSVPSVPSIRDDKGHTAGNQRTVNTPISPISTAAFKNSASMIKDEITFALITGPDNITGRLDLAMPEANSPQIFQLHESVTPF